MITAKKNVITGSTRLAGVIGWPIEHTLSPAMQNAAFRYYGLNVVYLPLGIPVAGLKVLLSALRQLRFLGANVTIPYKEQVIPWLDEIAASAKNIGAVNTIVNFQGRLIGHNTDGFGFLKSLQEVVAVPGKRAVVLGAGGGGRAVAISLALAKAGEISLADVDYVRAAKVARAIKDQGFSRVQVYKPGTAELKSQLANCELLVNATPLGLNPNDPLPIQPAWMPTKVCVMDLAYGKTLTPFLRLAKSQKNKIIPGWKMLLFQGAEAFRLWTGKQPPLALMQQALMAAKGIKAL